MLEDGISYLLDEDGSYIVLEGANLKRLVPGSDNEEIQKESDQFIDFTAFDPFAERNI
jgi:hypothetical protein